MRRRWVRVSARALAATGVLALVATVPNVAQAETEYAQAETEYDGSATALQLDGLTLTLFPGDEPFPPPFDQIPRPPEQVIELSSDQLGIPSEFGHAEYPGIDEPGALPANPLLSGGGFRAASTKMAGTVVSEAVIGHLDIAGGQLSVENIVARCTGDGQQISLEAPVGSIQGGALPAGGSIELEPNTETPIPGVGSITWNQQSTDGTKEGSVSNLLVELDSDLDADVLQNLPEAMSAFEDAIQDVLSDIKHAGDDAGLPEIPLNPEDLTGQPLYDALDDLLSQLPTGQLPDLNPLLKLTGSITLADAACAQTVSDEPNNPPPGEEPPDDQPPGDEPPDDQPPPDQKPDEPKLADTGASVWGPRAGIAGLFALTVGGALVLRQHRLSRKSTS